MEGEEQEFETGGFDSWYFLIFLSSFFEEKIFILFYLFFPTALLRYNWQIKIIYI